MWKTTPFLGNEGNSWVLIQKRGFCSCGFHCRVTESLLLHQPGASHPLSREIFHALEQKKSGILDADSKFKNILISFSRIADREGG